MNEGNCSTVVKTVDCHPSNSGLIISGSHWWHWDEQAAVTAPLVAPENYNLTPGHTQAAVPVPTTPESSNQLITADTAPLVVKCLKRP